MRIDATRRRPRSWKSTALQAATFLALVAGCGASSAEQTGASVPARAGGTQSTGDDPCRFATAEAIGKAFGRQMKSSRLAKVCEYRGTEAGAVVVQVTAGPEGTIMRHVKSAAAQGHKGAEKVATAVGEAYFDSILPVFIGRVGNHDVQLGTSIEPVPRDAMIAAGIRIMETIARK